MKARFLAITALILGMVSCQKDTTGFDVVVDGEQETTITVSLPEATRATSAQGAFEHLVGSQDYTIRYIFQVFYEGTELQAARQVIYTDENSVSFPVRLVPGRHYNFVVWADVTTTAGKIVDTIHNLTIADAAAADIHYNTTDLTNITLKKTWVAMDETRDAFTGHFDTEFDGDKTPYNGVKSIDIALTRPFAKLRVITTDMEQLNDIGIAPTKATVKYTVDHYNAFNAFAGKAIGDSKNRDIKHENFSIKAYDDNVNDKSKVLFTDYFFATDQEEVVNFTLKVYDQNGKIIGEETNFNTPIPARRNYLTTIQGNILTDGSNIKVDVDDDFENAGSTDPNYEYETISSVAEFYAAVDKLEQGGEYNYIVISDLNIDTTPITTRAATRSTTGTNGTKKVTIDLNGKTITVKNEGTKPFITLDNGQTLVLAGAGNIIMAEESKASFVDNNNSNGGVIIEEATVTNNSTSDDAKVVEGKVIVTGNADIKQNAVENNAIVYGLEALKYVLENGGEFTFANNLDSKKEILTVEKDVVINGNGFTLTSTADRAINVSGAQNVTIKNLNIVASGERAINVIQNSKNVTIENVTAKAANYTVNVAGSAPGAVVAIKNSTLNGLCTVNVASAGAYVTVEGSTVNCNDNNTTEGESYAALCLNKDAVGGSIIATNSTINVPEDSDSTAGRNGAENGVVTIDGSVERVAVMNAVITYPNSDYYHSFQTIAEAVEFADNGDKISLIRDVELTETLDIAKDIVLDLNGKTITGTDKNTAGNFYLIDNRGTLTISDSSEAKIGAIKLSAETERNWSASSVVVANNPGGKLVVDGGLIEHLGGTSMAYGIDVLTNGGNGDAHATVYGTVKSTYRAIRQFLNSDSHMNTLIVKDGAVIESTGGNKSIWMQDSSKKSNKGKLVVEGNAQIKSDVYLSVTAGSTEWPVEVSVANSALVGESKVTYSNVPEGYAVENIDGVWTVNAYTVVATAEELTEALANRENVSLSQDVNAESATTAPYGNKYAFKLDGGVINGNGHELYMECYGDDYGIMTSGGTIKNLTITEGCRAVMIMCPQEDVILDNVNIGGNGVLYPINTGEAGAEGVNLIVTNSTLAGWTSYGLIESATFTNVEFKQGTYYNNIYGRVFKPYVNTTLTDCTFIEHMNLDLSALKAGHKIVMKNCKVNGQAVTASVFTIPTTDAQYDTELFTIDLPSWASSINDCVVFE